MRKKVYAINPNGSIKWSLDVLGVVRESPAIDTDGTIYVSTRNKNKCTQLIQTVH